MIQILRKNAVLRREMYVETWRDSFKIHYISSASRDALWNLTFHRCWKLSFEWLILVLFGFSILVNWRWLDYFFFPKKFTSRSENEWRVLLKFIFAESLIYSNKACTWIDVVIFVMRIYFYPYITRCIYSHVWIISSWYWDEKTHQSINEMFFPTCFMSKLALWRMLSRYK